MGRSKFLCSYSVRCWAAACALLCSWMANGAEDPITTKEPPYPLNKSLSYLELNQRYFDLRAETERRLKQGDEATATLLAYNCISYSKLKQYSKLFECIERLEKRIASGDWRFRSFVGDIESAAWSANARPLPDLLRAEALVELGDYRGALAAGSRGLELVTDDTPSFKGTVWMGPKFRFGLLNTLILAAVQAGEPEQAQKFLAQLEAVEIPFLNRGVWGNLRNNALALGYMTVGQYDKALDRMSGGLIGSFSAAPLHRLVGYDAGDTPLTMSELPRLLMQAKALSATGKRDEAKEVLDNLLKLRRLAESGDLYWLALFERGRIAQEEGDLEKARELYRRAIELIELQRSSINTEAGKIGFVGNKQELYGHLVSVLMAQNRYADAFAYVERSKARALVDLLAGKKDFSVASGDPKRVQELLATADSEELSMRAVQADASSATQTRGAVVAAREQIASQAPELVSLVSVNTLTASGVQQALPADETLVEYFYSGKDLYTFVVSRQGVFGAKTGAEKLEDDVHAFRTAIAQPPTERWKEPSVALYSRLIGPIRDKLVTPNILIVAHGALHYEPFNALHDGKQFLIENYSIRLLPGATVLEFLKPKPAAKPGTLLAFGNPDLGDKRFDLAFAQKEAEDVVQTMPNSRALLRRDATKTAFRKYSSDFQMLHVASHGDFEPEKPLASSLLLAPDASDDGRLTVSDLYSMRVDADLITLSACETGLGKVASGDDVVGLTRGFLYAGTRTIVASLWEVDDRATGELMTAFYQSLGKGVGKREALRLAQMDFLKKQPHPFFWAAFQLTGNP